MDAAGFRLARRPRLRARHQHVVKSRSDRQTGEILCTGYLLKFSQAALDALDEHVQVG